MQESLYKKEKSPWKRGAPLASALMPLRSHWLMAYKKKRFLKNKSETNVKHIAVLFPERALSGRPLPANPEDMKRRFWACSLHSTTSGGWEVQVREPIQLAPELRAASDQPFVEAVPQPKTIAVDEI